MLVDANAVLRACARLQRSPGSQPSPKHTRPHSSDGIRRTPSPVASRKLCCSTTCDEPCWLCRKGAHQRVRAQACDTVTASRQSSATQQSPELSSYRLIRLIQSLLPCDGSPACIRKAAPPISSAPFRLTRLRVKDWVCRQLMTCRLEKSKQPHPRELAAPINARRSSPSDL